MSTNETAAPDFSEAWREWATQSERQWNEFFNQMMGTEEFSQSLGRNLDVFLHFQKTMNEAMGSFFTAMNVPTRTDVLALGDRMLALAGTVADGAFLAWCPPGEVATKRAVVHEAARAAGRDPDSVELVCSFWGYAGDRPDEARERMRRAVLAYAMVPTHQHCFAGCFPRLTEAAEAWAAGDRREALDCVDDAVVEAVCAVGEDAVRRRVAEYRDVGIDTPILLPTGVMPGDSEGSMQTVLRCAP